LISLSEEHATDVLLDRLGYRFVDHAHIRQALTHRSWCSEHIGVDSNERLEFLGDSVFGLVVTNYIYATYPDLPEGKLAKLRAEVVSSVSLAAVARDLGLGLALALGKGEEASGGRDKSSILADTLEAVLGAVYLDGGWANAERIVLSLFRGRIASGSTEPGVEDFKTRLQEHAARNLESLPEYLVSDEGPDHEKHFFATVVVAGRELGRGEGRSKKEAEQAAAHAAWDLLGSEQHEERSNDPVEAVS